MIIESSLTIQENDMKKVKVIVLIIVIAFLMLIFYQPAKIHVHNLTSSEPINYTSYKLNGNKEVEKILTATVEYAKPFNFKESVYYLVETSDGALYFIDDPEVGEKLEAGDTITFLKNRLAHDIYVIEVE